LSGELPACLNSPGVDLTRAESAAEGYPSGGSDPEVSHSGEHGAGGPRPGPEAPQRDTVRDSPCAMPLPARSVLTEVAFADLAKYDGRVLDEENIFPPSWVLRFCCSVLLALATMGLTSCSRPTPCGRDASGMPKCVVSEGFVQSLPESTLSFPGSTVYSQNIRGEQHLIGETNPAGAHAIYATTAPMSEVDAWYRKWLTTHGWQTSDADAVLPLEVSAQGYSKGNRESFVLGADSQKIGKILGYRFPAKMQSETLYEVNFLIEPYSGG